MLVAPAQYARQRKGLGLAELWCEIAGVSAADDVPKTRVFGTAAPQGRLSTITRRAARPAIQVARVLATRSEAGIPQGPATRFFVDDLRFRTYPV